MRQLILITMIDSAFLSGKDIDSQPVWPEAHDNCASYHHVGDFSEVEKAEKISAYLITVPIHISRITAVAMEPRIACAKLLKRASPFLLLALKIRSHCAQK